MRTADLQAFISSAFPANSLSAAVEAHARHTPDAPAILAPGRPPLTYGVLWQQVQTASLQLRAWGITRADRVAFALPDGPEGAVVFLSVIAVATAVPLNPALPVTELTAYLTEVRAKALIAPAGTDTAATTAAQGMGIPVIRLTPRAEAAGLFRLTGARNSAPATEDMMTPDDMAVILRTSGTTSQAKSVPLTQANIWAVAHDTLRGRELTSADRCLIMMHLFHIYGIILEVGMILAGGSAIYVSDFQVDEFFTVLDTYHPTWVSAVAPMYQAVLQQAPRHADVLACHSLRFLSAGAAALPGPVMQELEVVFQAPVLPAYGMTETGIITSMPRPPRARKYGSVGVPVRQNVRVIDEQGNERVSGQIGEVIVRGAAVMSGYEDNPEANRAAFVDGWFRTGDAGYLDEDGYLFLTGRFKEMINRGGEKVTPIEVEEILLSHPAVAQAVVFALPHATLGEDVGAAIVLKPGAMTTERELRLFVGEHLATFKVPRRIVFLDVLPLNHTGKVQRIGLAARLGLDVVPSVGYVAPRDALEERLASIWARVLEVARLGIHDNFFDLGGNSLLAARLCTAMEDAVERRLPAAVLLEAPTIADLVTLLHRTEGPLVLPTLVPLQPLGRRPPLFCVAALNRPGLVFRDLAHLLGDEQPVYALQTTMNAGAEQGSWTVEDVAAAYMEALRTIQPHGPYHLAGSSSGGILAFEMAQQLRSLGEQVALVVLFDSLCPGSGAPLSPLTYSLGRLRYRVHALAARGRYHAMQWTIMRPAERPAYLRGRLTDAYHRVRHTRSRVEHRAADEGYPREIPPEVRVMVLRYRPRPYAGRVVLFWSSGNPLGQLGGADPRLGWRRLAQNGLEIHYMPGRHCDFLYYHPHTRQLAAELTACLRRARRTGTPFLPT